MAERPHLEPLAGVGPGLGEILIAAGKAASHLYESVTAGGSPSRWSILFSASTERIVRRGDGRIERNGEPSAASRFLDAFEAARCERAAPKGAGALFAAHGLPGDFPFLGGWSFFLSYELAGEIEPTLDLPAFALGARSGFPGALAEYHPAALIRDHVEGRDYLVHDRSGEGQRLAAALVAARRQAVTDTGELAPPGLSCLEPPSGARYRDGVRQVREYLFAGDVFQANLSHAWRFRLAEGADAAAAWRSLCRRNPAPFAAWYRQPEGQILASSPERLVRVADGRAETRPIAGTRRRDSDPGRDRALVEQLKGHPKERAEHVMLIDLERNDLGRVCMPGTVAVDELMAVESYAHVHHLVSNIGGRLPDDASPLAALAATFPGGTITGCPKVRCMQILAELEAGGRGPYTGSLGYLSAHGRLDSNILIRSLFLAPDGQGEFRTGAGIVADSRPHRELEETLEKARGLLDALGGPQAVERGRPS